MQPVESIYSKLQGVTYSNPDGSDRQELIAHLCFPGQPLLLMHAPNHYSQDNLDVYVAFQIGQVNRELAEMLGPFIAQGGAVEARITEITGGTEDKPTRGVNVEFTIFE